MNIGVQMSWLLYQLDLPDTMLLLLLSHYALCPSIFMKSSKVMEVVNRVV